MAKTLVKKTEVKKQAEKSESNPQTNLAVLINERIAFCKSIIDEKDTEQITVDATKKVMHDWNELKNFVDGTINSVSDKVVSDTLDKTSDALANDHNKILDKYLFTHDPFLKAECNKMLADSIVYLKRVRSAKQELLTIITNKKQ